MIIYVYILIPIAIVGFGISIFLLFTKYPPLVNMFKKPTGIAIVSWSLLAICSVVLAISLWRTNYIIDNTNKYNIDYTNVGAYGDLIGGILNPVVAFIGIVAAGLAFYAQYRANQLIQEQFKIQQFESQFYEMLRLHKENVAGLYTKINKKIDGKIVESTIYGRRVFESFTLELVIAYLVALYSFKTENITPKELLNEAYAVFFIGLNYSDTKKHVYFENLYKLRALIRNFDYEGFDKEIKNQIKVHSDELISRNVEFQIFEGNNHQLAHYYRHLFHMVKFVVNNNHQFLTYDLKRNYLRILRAQLSNTEQILLFYNWYSGFGKQWENDKNKFFTDYRMIHNLYNDILISSFKLDEIFDLNGDYQKEEGRIIDSLFEFQDWFDETNKK